MPPAATPTPAAPDEPAQALQAALVALLRGLVGGGQGAAAWWQPAGLPAPRLRWPAAAPEAPGADARCLGRAEAGAEVFELWLALPAAGAEAAAEAALAAATGALQLHQAAEQWRTEARRRGLAGSVASDWQWETDADGRVVWMSDAISLLTGRPVSEEIGRGTGEMNRRRDDEYGASWDRYLQARAAHEPFRELIVDRETPEGTITVSISGDPRLDAEGRFLGYRGVSRNVTAEITARKAAARAQMLLEQTLEGLPAAVMISGPDGRVLLANRRWHESMGEGLPPGCDTWPQVLHHHVAAGHYPAAAGREAEFEAWRLQLVGDDPVPQELQWREHWVLVFDRRLPDGSVVHLSVDVSARKQAEAALAESELRWRFALEGAGDAVWDWDARSNRTYFSRRWKQMLGFEDHEIGDDWRAWARRVHPDDRAAVFAALQAHIEGRSEVYDTEHRVMHKDGHWVWLRDRGKAVLRDAQGRALRMVGTHADITRQREADAALLARQAAEQAAEMASRSKSEFLSRMSHEMRTPLNALLGFAQLMQQQNAFRADYLGHILLAGQHLRDLINDVLDLQQVEQGMLALQPVPIDLAQAVRDAAALLAPAAQRAGVHQAFELPPRTAAAAAVLADPQRLRQVLLNLGSNAVKYNRRGGSVRWSLAAAERAGQPGWRLALRDQGLGMDAQQLARLFQPFERLGREASSVEGTGLGLVIARRLVQAQGGELAIDSQAGVGTTVSLWLPRTEQALPAATAGPGAVPARAAPEQRWRVLYVEDDALSALLMSEALRAQSQIELRVAGDGAAAQALAQQWPPQLLIIDGHLPGSLGHEVLAALRALPGLAQVPAVMATADAMPADREAALARGFVAHWPKPLDVRGLGARVLALLQGEGQPVV
jgi:PAS domain S-box-containing protein